MSAKRFSLRYKHVFSVLIFSIILMPIASYAQSDAQNLSTEEALASAIVPERDLNDLALRLGGVASIPDVPTSPIRQYQVGDRDQFFVHGDNEVTEVNAELVYMNDVVYMWFEVGFSPDLALVKQLADRFATEIYPRVRAVFGSEASPGVDGDPRLHILHSNNIGVGVAGFFYSLHQYSSLAIAVSNQREMFFMAPDLFSVPNDYYLGVLAHEFEHMIQFNVDSNEDSWMDEGLAELATYEAGLGPSDFTADYLANPSVQLNFWPTSQHGRIYGGSFLFHAYLRERYGVDFIQALVANQANGMASVQNTLDAFGITDPFTGEPMLVESIFSEWAIANVLGNNTIEDGRYGYHDPELQAFGTAQIQNSYEFLPISIQSTINQWGANYYQIKGHALAGRTVQMTFEGSSEVRLQPTNAHSGDYAYWSHRTNSGDARLTIPLDLSSVDNATLSYWTWYDIEEYWDWLYVVISVDDGKTWQIVSTPRMTDENPFGTGYGYGYTGQSGEWVQEQIDLSPYAGQSILVRFEYITDDATLGNGFLLDDVEVSAIGFFDDFEKPNPIWIEEGWVLSNNRLPQHFSIHFIQRDDDGRIAIQRLLGPRDGVQGSWAFTFPTDVKDVVLVVSAFAPLTTEPATINIAISE
ncbi:MAG: hypothetical protein CUN55_07310 [Phototrophicales bacterium]|nr:MAG: hypothetical protein CUN55_07310 [Phototrophicales bacterium]